MRFNTLALATLVISCYNHNNAAVAFAPRQSSLSVKNNNKNASQRGLRKDLLLLPSSSAMRLQKKARLDSPASARLTSSLLSTAINNATEIETETTATTATTNTWTSSQKSIQDMTSIFLDSNKYPIGCLDDSILNRFYPTLLSWCKNHDNDKNSPYTVDKLIKRIEDEQDNALRSSSAENISNNLLEENANHIRRLRCKYYCHAIEAWERTNGGRANFVSKQSCMRAEDYLSKIEKELLSMTNLNEINYNDSITSIRKVLDHIVVSYNTVIKMWRDNGSAKNAENVLERMEDVSKRFIDIMRSNNDDEVLSIFRPNAISYTTVIDAHAKSSEGNKKNNAINANNMFLRMKQAFEKGSVDCEPDIRSFNSLINAWIGVGDIPSVERAQDILYRMEQLYYDSEEDDDTYDADRNTINGKNVLYRIKPTVITYSTVMNGWSKSGADDSYERSKNIFKRMVRMYMYGNNADAKPNLFSYVALINSAICNFQIDASAPNKADAILRSMVEPTLNNYNDNEDDDDDIPRIDDGTVIYPNVQIITKVIDCYGKVGNGEKAEALLDWMIDLYKQTSDPNIRPNEITFNAVINAWSKSRSFGKAGRANDILQRIHDLNEQGIVEKHVKPNAIMCTGVLNACAYTIGDLTEKNTALQIATDIFKNVVINSNNDNGGNIIRPNHITYATMITACKNLIPVTDERRNRIISTVFKRCCMDGHVSPLVIKRIETASLSNDELLKLFEDCNGGAVVVAADNVVSNMAAKVDMSKLPQEWTCNVKDTRIKNNHRRQRRQNQR